MEPTGTQPPAPLRAADGPTSPGDRESATSPVSRDRPEPSPAAPLSAAELDLALRRPDVLASQVLGSADRLAANLSEDGSQGRLLLVFLAASLLTSVPFGALTPVGHWWSVPVLFAGSLALCLPCLYVFFQYLGLGAPLDRTVTLGLVVPAAAGIFTLGFAPIAWFMDATTAAAPDSEVTPVGLARFLLCASLLLGVAQMLRVAGARRAHARPQSGLILLLVLWLPLLIFIVRRMAAALGIWP